MATAAELVFGEALRALVGQEVELKDIRARGVSLVTAGSVILAFMAPTSVAENANALAVVATAVAYVAQVLLLVDILRPRDGWKINSHVAKLIEEVKGDVDSDGYNLKMAKRLDGRYDSNRQILDTLYERLRAMVVLLGLQAIAFVALLMTTGG